MPITIEQLTKAFKLQNAKKVKWGEKLNTENEGIYIISLSDNPKLNNGLYKQIPISKNILKKWIDKVNGFKVDNIITFDENIISERLSKFWLPDENIIYIGKAPVRNNGKGLNNRVNEFYKTEYGEKRPHAGGHWIKTLDIFENLYVYFIECKNSSKIEYELLEYFGNNISDKSKENLMDKDLILPFGNIEITKGKRKKHGLGKMKI